MNIKSKILTGAVALVVGASTVLAATNASAYPGDRDQDDARYQNRTQQNQGRYDNNRNQPQLNGRYDNDRNQQNRGQYDNNRGQYDNNRGQYSQAATAILSTAILKDFRAHFQAVFVKSFIATIPTMFAIITTTPTILTPAHLSIFGFRSSIFISSLAVNTWSLDVKRSRMEPSSLEASTRPSLHAHLSGTS